MTTLRLTHCAPSSVQPPGTCSRSVRSSVQFSPHCRLQVANAERLTQQPSRVDEFDARMSGIECRWAATYGEIRTATTGYVSDA